MKTFLLGTVFGCVLLGALIYLMQPGHKYSISGLKGTILSHPNIDTTAGVTDNTQTVATDNTVRGEVVNISTSGGEVIKIYITGGEVTNLSEGVEEPIDPNNTGGINPGPPASIGSPTNN